MYRKRRPYAHWRETGLACSKGERNETVQAGAGWKLRGFQRASFAQRNQPVLCTGRSASSSAMEVL